MAVRGMLHTMLLGASLVVSSAWGATQALPAALQALQKEGVEVVQQFDAPAGLHGYIVNAGGQSHAVYVTGDGNHVMVGALLDAKGRNLTETHLEKFAPKPDLSHAWPLLEDARWVADGAKDPKSVVYVLADPYCPYCRAFALAAQPYEEIGLQVRWIWVSYLRADGPSRAAAILEAEDPAAAMERHEQMFAQGGIEPAKSAKPETLAAVRSNTDLMRTLGVNGTPAIFFKNKEGDVQVVQGMPKLSVLPQIFDLPEQPNDNPALARFR